MLLKPTGIHAPAHGRLLTLVEAARVAQFRCTAPELRCCFWMRAFYNRPERVFRYDVNFRRESRAGCSLVGVEGGGIEDLERIRGHKKMRADSVILMGKADVRELHHR